MDPFRKSALTYGKIMCSWKVIDQPKCAVIGVAFSCNFDANFALDFVQLTLFVLLPYEVLHEVDKF